MIKNLLKTPLMAIIYISLLEFAKVFLPLSETYTAAMSEFSMPILGYVFQLGFGLLVSIVVTVLFTVMESPGIVGAILTTLTLAGLQWIVPALHPFWFGEPSGTATRQDILLLTGSRVLCTILLVVLAVLLFSKKADKADPAAKPEKPPYKLGVLGLIIRMIALPIIYIVLYLPTWYFLGWNSEIVRAYYGSAAADEGFVAAVINLLLADGTVLLYCLLAGLAGALFALPLMTRMQGKRLVYIICTVLLFLSPVLLYLVPSPLIADEVRIKLLVRDAALMGAYGILSAVLLHFSWRKVAEAPKKDAKPSEPAEKAAGPNAKQAAGAVRMTMQGK